MEFALRVHQIDLIASVTADIHVLAQLDVSLGTEDQRSSITPTRQSIRREPIDSEIMARSVVTDQTRFTKILQLWCLRVVVVGNGCAQYGRISRSGKVQELLDLVTADIAKDSSVARPLKKPFRSTGGIEPVGTQP